MKAKNGPPLYSEGDEGEWARVKMVWVSTPSIRHSLRKQGIQKDNQSRMDPRFAARVTKVQGKHPFRPSFFAKAGNLEIQSVKHGPPLCSDTTGIQNLAHPERV